MDHFFWDQAIADAVTYDLESLGIEHEVICGCVRDHGQTECIDMGSSCRSGVYIRAHDKYNELIASLRKLAEDRADNVKLPQFISMEHERNWPEEQEIVLAYFKETGLDIMRFHRLEGKERAFGRCLFSSCMGFLTDDVTHYMKLGKNLQEALAKRHYA
jgi:hypothetical protein